METMVTNPSPYLLWQLKLLLAYYDYGHKRIASEGCEKSSLVNPEMCASVASQVELNLETWTQGMDIVHI